MESLRESLVKWPVRGKLTRLSAFGCAAEGVRGGQGRAVGLSLHLSVEGGEFFKGQRGLEFPGPVPVHGSRSVVDDERG